MAISAATALNRRTVEKSLAALGSLVEKRKGRWWAVEPTSDQSNWFAVRKNHQGKHWSDRFATIKLFLPKSDAKVGRRRFGIKQAALFSELYSFSRKNGTVTTTLAGLSKIMNGTRRNDDPRRARPVAGGGSHSVVRDMDGVLR